MTQLCGFITRNRLVQIKIVFIEGYQVTLWYLASYSLMHGLLDFGLPTFDTVLYNNSVIFNRC
jgi:hypothetical protein